ncbi:hypothetical protein BBF96_10570 [Anoxybacter fermentans]|uniref:SLH domain-containing protein n=1 Tax=Anoxybacter fermentans TaxID=1323375 RepID=A0A3Q9HRL4_9FIRM|nr:S-layer homology domain-containing protein [Anoxybacter fermentans]AZR73790.1 hypothetical protein BBF96_10570 [Anoxybacter fermentans]
MKKIATLFLLSVVLVFVITSTTLANPSDIKGHWAEDYITSLLDQNIMKVYDDGKFKPNQPITRAEFAEALARSLYLDQMYTTELTDIDSHPARGYIAALVNEGIVTGFPDKTFRPEEKLTRAQVVTMLIRALGLEEKQNQINMSHFQSYLDMSEDHWANIYVKLATELDILNGYPDGTFRPNELTTRAQAAKMLKIFKNYKTMTGFVAEVYPASNKLAITSLNGERIVLSLSDTALIGRNNRLVPITEFLKTDRVFIITDESNQARYVKAYGLITKADLTEKVSQMTDYILEPFEVEAIAKGDFNAIKPKLINQIRTRLLDSGLTPDEVEAILNTDWNTLEEYGKIRLSEAISLETGLPLDMVKAIMEQDWEKVKALAKVEVIHRLVQEMMRYDLLS